ncbi:hypothetical protein DL96DRAFT_841631 [Flagelloscypha sp. PMI_526]|nr:hypothetical protein DL96DRAFT_841631 [Flagelloscypha sp. PMI_526]
MFSEQTAAESSRLVVTRKSHKKSRAGCMGCKARRVKCDEVRPICKSCSRRREPCVWHERSPDPLATILPDAASSSLKISVDHQLSLPPLSDFRIRDLELLHHWTTNTVLTLIPDVLQTRYGFQVVLPQLAFQNEFLLHAIFAITSLHLHTLRSSSNNLELAKLYCQHAIIGLSNAGQSATLHNASLANTLLAVYWLASPSWSGVSQDGIPDLFDWFSTSRIFMGRLGFYHDELLKRQSQAPPFSTGIVTIPGVVAPFPTILYHIHRPEVCPFDIEELNEPGTSAAYDMALTQLTETWSAFVHPNLHYMAIYLFLSMVNDEFFRLFSKKRSRAIIIVAHYCAILGQFQDVWWYSWERARTDIHRVMSLLDEKWFPWMEYPLSVVAMKDNVGMPGYGSSSDHFDPTCHISCSASSQHSVDGTVLRYNRSGRTMLPSLTPRLARLFKRFSVV